MSVQYSKNKRWRIKNSQKWSKILNGFSDRRTAKHVNKARKQIKIVYYEKIVNIKHFFKAFLVEWLKKFLFSLLIFEITYSALPLWWSTLSRRKIRFWIPTVNAWEWSACITKKPRRVWSTRAPVITVFRMRANKKILAKKRSSYTSNTTEAPTGYEICNALPCIALTCDADLFLRIPACITLAYYSVRCRAPIIAIRTKAAKWKSGCLWWIHSESRFYVFTVTVAIAINLIGLWKMSYEIINNSTGKGGILHM